MEILVTYSESHGVLVTLRLLVHVRGYNCQNVLHIIILDIFFIPYRNSLL